MHLDWLIVGGGVFWLLWATYMKTFRTDTWLQLQEAGDQRRGRIIKALGASVVNCGRHFLSAFRN